MNAASSCFFHSFVCGLTDGGHTHNDLLLFNETALLCFFIVVNKINHRNGGVFHRFPRSWSHLSLTHKRTPKDTKLRDSPAPVEGMPSALSVNAAVVKHGAAQVLHLFCFGSARSHQNGIKWTMDADCNTSARRGPPQRVEKRRTRVFDQFFGRCHPAAPSRKIEGFK